MGKKKDLTEKEKNFYVNDCIQSIASIIENETGLKTKKASWNGTTASVIVSAKRFFVQKIDVVHGYEAGAYMVLQDISPCPIDLRSELYRIAKEQVARLNSTFEN